MKISIKNLGVVQEGVIDLSKRINLFCGLNSTGKTYVSYVIYGLLRNRLHIPIKNNIAEELINNHKVKETIDFDLLVKYRIQMIVSLQKKIDYVFGVGSDIVEKLFKDFSVNFLESNEEFRERIVMSSFTINHMRFGINFMMKKDSGDDFISVSIPDEPIQSVAVPAIRSELLTWIYYVLATYPLGDAAVFPVERNSIYTFSKELSIRKQEAFDNIQLLVDTNKKISKFDVYSQSKRYPLPVRQGLLIAEDLVEVKKSRSDFYSFAEEIEKDLIKGRVLISNEGEIQFRPLKAQRSVLPIQMTASIVKTLSSLVVFLKHIAEKNDLIIIDEPEINLHPSNQIVVARFLARLSNAGFRLIISTHSDYIIREFNNLIMMSHKEIPAIRKKIQEFGYKADEYVKPEDIMVNNFSCKNKKTSWVTISGIPVDKFGFAVESIDNTINEQNKIAEEAYFALKYGSLDE